MLKVGQDVLDLIKEKIKNKYSTSENVIGEWIDGKPVYRKVIIATKSTVNSQLTSLNIKDYISFWGMAVAVYNNSFPIPNYFVPEAGYRIDFIGGTGMNNVTLGFGSYYNDNSPVKIIVEYTKTTD